MTRLTNIVMGLMVMGSWTAFASDRVAADLAGQYELTNARYGLCEPQTTARITSGLSGDGEVWIGQYFFNQDRTIREDELTKVVTTNRYRTRVIMQEHLVVNKVEHTQQTSYVYVKWGAGQLWIQAGVRGQPSSLMECFYRKVSNDPNRLPPINGRPSPGN